MTPRTFELVRHRDPSGVSGTGVVAEGCVFTDGSVALRWRGSNPATAVWPDLDSVLAVHGHQGATEVQWLGTDRVPATVPDRLDSPTPEPRGEVVGGPVSAAEELFAVQHLVRPPSALTEPLVDGHQHGWSRARHLR